MYKIQSFFLLLLLFSLSLASCHTVAPDLDYTALARASVKLGMDIEATDNHALYIEAAKWLGTPHRTGGSSRRGVDCSGLTVNLYKTVYHKKLPRDSSAQKKNTRRVWKQHLREGDLVFFATSGRKRRISHVGIYLKDGCFVHASTSQGVIVSRLDEPYYRKHWAGAGRLP